MIGLEDRMRLGVFLLTIVPEEVEEKNVSEMFCDAVKMRFIYLTDKSC